MTTHRQPQDEARKRFEQILSLCELNAAETLREKAAQEAREREWQRTCRLATITALLVVTAAGIASVWWASLAGACSLLLIALLVMVRQAQHKANTLDHEARLERLQRRRNEIWRTGT